MIEPKISPDVLLIYIKEYLKETKFFEEQYLRIRYGERWTEFIQHHVGIGYEICKTLLDHIERQESMSIDYSLPRVTEYALIRHRISLYCEKECPSQICGRCPLRIYSPVFKYKGNLTEDEA